MEESPPHTPQATVAGSPLSGTGTWVAAEFLEQNKAGETAGGKCHRGKHIDILYNYSFIIIIFCLHIYLCTA